ncbi:hypothetical protein PybrP1_008769 [[Pythium] brassicae (nom. inval.)]|nr:hypothetical protein PybrP1_008769 [[Pythium] brassicae (nom. inval.)]
MPAATPKVPSPTTIKPAPQSTPRAPTTSPAPMPSPAPRPTKVCATPRFGYCERQGVAPPCCPAGQECRPVSR